MHSIIIATICLHLMSKGSRQSEREDTMPAGHTKKTTLRNNTVFSFNQEINPQARETVHLAPAFVAEMIFREPAQGWLVDSRMPA